MKIQKLGAVDSTCFLFFFLLLNACGQAPVKNQTVSTKPDAQTVAQCDIFLSRSESTAYILQNSTRHIEVSLKEEEGSGPIEVIVSIGSKIGDRFRVDQGKIRFKFEFNDWIEAQAELVSIQDIDWKNSKQRDLSKVRPDPKLEYKSFQQDHQFQVSGDYNRNFVLMKASMPIYKRDFEIEIPRIVIEGEEFPSRIFKYKWNNRWMASNMSGCPAVEK